MHFSGKLGGEAGPVALASRVVGGDRFPESPDAGARQRVGQERDGPRVLGTTLGVQVGFNKKWPGRAEKRDAERPIFTHGPLECRANIVELGHVLIEPDGLIRGPVFLVGGIQQLQQGRGHARPRQLQFIAGFETIERIEACGLEQAMARRLRL